jgi:hypothetical protein
MKITARLILLFISGLMLTFVSCEDDQFDDPFADPVDKFLGTWKCNEQEIPPDGLWVYDVVITRNPQNSSEILISNFNLQGSSERARALIAGNSLTIPTQLMCDDTIEIKGSGSFSNGEVSLSYTTLDGADLKSFSAKYFKP